MRGFPCATVLAILLGGAVGTGFSAETSAEATVSGLISRALQSESPTPVSSERVLSLLSIHDVARDGSVTVEQRFTISVSGDKIKRGPKLSFLTAYRGPGGLVLDKEFEALELWRDDQPEPFHVDRRVGARDIFFGTRDHILKPDTYDYVFRYREKGGWKFRNGEAIGEFEASGPFQNFEVDSAKMIVRFPQGVELSKYSPVVHGGRGPVPGYRSRVNGGELVIETTGSLETNHLFLVNAIWNADSFASRSVWSETLRQHPKIPLAIFSASILLVALLLLVRRIQISRPAPATA